MWAHGPLGLTGGVELVLESGEEKLLLVLGAGWVSQTVCGRLGGAPGVKIG